MSKKVVIAGAGVMGASLAQVYALAGYEVTVYDVMAAGIEKGKHLVDLNQQTLVNEHLITEEQSKQAYALISYTLEKDCFRDCDLVVECIVERMDVKQSFWHKSAVWRPPMHCWPPTPAVCTLRRSPPPWRSPSASWVSTG